jgi:protein tyrosine phosphatase
MPISQDALQHVYHLLTKRESVRVSYSNQAHHLTHHIHRHGAPEEVFYSVRNSLKYRKSNRYSNILAYDRTAVQVDGDGYLNANVVCDGKGNWWVASQVSGVGRAGMGGGGGRFPKGMGDVKLMDVRDIARAESG